MKIKRNRKNKKTLVSIRCAAQQWGMSEGALRRRIQSGLIEAVKAPSPRSRRAGLFIQATTVSALRAARWCSKDEDAPRRFAQEVAGR